MTPQHQTKEVLEMLQSPAYLGFIVRDLEEKQSSITSGGLPPSAVTKKIVEHTVDYVLKELQSKGLSN